MMSYTDLRDFEAEYTRTFDDGTVVEVEKLGGGSTLVAYTGRWRYRHTADDGVVEQGQDLETGMPTTHATVAEMVYEYFDNEE